MGVKEGDIITVCMSNIYQAISTFLACNRIGAAVTILNRHMPFSNICEYLNLYESPILVNYDSSQEFNEKIKKQTAVRYIVTLKPENINLLNICNDYRNAKNFYEIDYNSLGSIAKYQHKGLPVNNACDDALILYTSGTTGKPKPVVLTNKNVVAASIYLKNSSHAKSLNGDKSLVSVPFSYPYGFVTSAMSTLMCNKTAVLAPSISKENISYYLSKGINIIFGSPALLELIMKNVPDDQDLSSVTTIISGGDFFLPTLYKRTQDFFAQHGAKNIEIGNGSGNAETVSCGTNPTGVKLKEHTVGKVLTGTDAIVVDPETMEEKKYNELGMLCVAGDHVFKEYYKDPERTSKAKFERNGKTYFKTGNLGSLDDEGYFTLMGRDARFYIVSSLDKVYCDRVQNIISYIDCIDSCAVVEIPDNEQLYKNVVYVVLKKGYLPTEETKRMLYDAFRKPIRTHANEEEQLNSIEIPSRIEFVEELPRKEGMEKIDYEFLKKDAISKEKGYSRVLKK